RVPFLVRWPGQAPAGTVNHTSIVTAVDLLPTFAEVGGATLPSGFVSDGQSLVSLFKGNTENYHRNKPMFWEWRSPVRSERASMLAVRDGDWKLFVHQHDGRVELYNLEVDEGETQNIASQYPERVETLRQLALDWHETLPVSPTTEAISTMRVR
ncbi:MAG: sulfatase/phosphatase domain-containing protein, partial [Pseudomonadota bacterium]